MSGRIEHDCHDITVSRGAVEADHLKAVFVGVHPHFVGGVGREHHIGAHPTGVITGPFAIRGEFEVHFVPRRCRAVHCSRLVDAIINAVVELRDGQGVAILSAKAVDLVQVFNNRFIRPVAAIIVTIVNVIEGNLT